MSLGQKKWVRIAYIIYYLLLAAASLYCFVHGLKGLDMAPVAAFTCFLVPLALKLQHLKPIFEMYILNVVFAAMPALPAACWMPMRFLISIRSYIFAVVFDHLTGIHPIFLFYEENRLSKSARTALLHFLLQCV